MLADLIDTSIPADNILKKKAEKSTETQTWKRLK
jgi:hypothetical protein